MVNIYVFNIHKNLNKNILLAVENYLFDFDNLSVFLINQSLMMEVKDYIWIEDDKYSWVPGKITSNSDGQYKVEIEIDGEIESRFVSTSNTYSEVHPSCLSI